MLRGQEQERHLTPGLALRGRAGEWVGAPAAGLYTVRPDVETRLALEPAGTIHCTCHEVGAAHWMFLTGM